MHRRIVLLTSVLLLGSGALLASTSPPAAALRVAEPSTAGAVVDLKTGEVRIQNPQITVLAPLEDTDGDGYYEGVLQVSVDPALGYERMTLVLDYDEAPQDYTFNLGDSISNNGGGGDGSDQSRDAELVIEATSAAVAGPEINVFASEVGGGSWISRSLPGIFDSSLRMSVSDMFVGWSAPYTHLDFTGSTDGADLLFALGGQSDVEGPVNHDLFVGMNRVVGPSFPPRIGSGLARVSIGLE